MVTIDSNLLAAFVGAVTGGAASLAGSIYVGRRDLTRKTRIHMYHDLIPPLQEEICRLIERKPQSMKPREEVYRAVEALARQGILAGRTVSRRLTAVENLCQDQQRTYKTWEERSLQGKPKFTEEVQRENSRLEEEYQRKLAEAVSRGKGTYGLERGTSPVMEQYRAAEAHLEKELQGYKVHFFELDRSIAKQLNAIHQFLRRKIR
jgi:hypothetical protein